MEFLELLGAEERRELEQLGRRWTADRQEKLIARGDPGDRVIVIEAGRMKMIEVHDLAALRDRAPG